MTLHSIPLIILTTFCSLAFSWTVVVDPGHGGKDRGATRANEHEADLVLKVALELEKQLEADNRFRVALTRRTDSFISLEDRGAFARNAKADLLISLHMNSSDQPKAYGAEFYFQNQLPPDEESMYLAARENSEETREMSLSESLARIPGLPRDSEAQIILDDLVRNSRIRLSHKLVHSLISNWTGAAHRSKSNAVRQAPFYVISNVNMPSVLVELGFLSNETEAKLMRSPGHQKQIAQGLYRGLVNFCDFIDSHKNAP